MIWNETVRTIYILTTISKILLEILFIHNLYLLQRITTNADNPVDENHNPIEPLTFSQVWIIPEKYMCRLGEESHSACAQVHFEELFLTLIFLTKF